MDHDINVVAQTNSPIKKKRRWLIPTIVIVIVIVGAIAVLSYTEQQKTIAQTTPHVVTFEPIGLPAGGFWYVEITGKGISENLSAQSTQSISFNLINGTYAFGAFVIPKGLYEPYGNNIQVSGPMTEDIVFAPIQQTVTAVNVNIEYDGITSGYFGNAEQSWSGFTYSPGEPITYTITFQSSAFLLDHNISSIQSGDSDFSISSINPNLPVTVVPGGSISITFTINTPAWIVWNGPITLIVVTY
ncbi:MAG: hypothetical protein QXJ62_06035 [Nitrososphaeria archaeon]